MVLIPVKSTLRTLVVDDDRTICVLYRRMLEDLFYDVEITTSGETAVQLFKDNEYDLIFMDIEIPDLDGFEATKQIRDVNGDPEFPIIVALSGHIDNTAIMKKCAVAGMNDCLTKPLHKETVKKRLEIWKKDPSAIMKNFLSHTG